MHFHHLWLEAYEIANMHAFVIDTLDRLCWFKCAMHMQVMLHAFFADFRMVLVQCSKEPCCGFNVVLEETVKHWCLCDPKCTTTVQRLDQLSFSCIASHMCSQQRLQPTIVAIYGISNKWKMRYSYPTYTNGDRTSLTCAQIMHELMVQAP